MDVQEIVNIFNSDNVSAQEEIAGLIPDGLLRELSKKDRSLFNQVVDARKALVIKGRPLVRREGGYTLPVKEFRNGAVVIGSKELDENQKAALSWYEAKLKSRRGGN